MYGTQDLHDSILVIPHAHMYWWWVVRAWMWVLPGFRPALSLPRLAVERVCYKMGWIVVALFCCCSLVRGMMTPVLHTEPHDSRNDRMVGP